MEKQKKIRRFIPCSLYCTDKIEKWLEDMAAEGYVFYNFSTFDYAVFTQQTPQKIRYRIWLKGKEKYADEARSLRQKYGWQLTDEMKNLELYRSVGAEIPGIENDERLTEIHNDAIKYHTKQNTLSFILLLLPIAIYILFEEIGTSTVSFGLSAFIMPIFLLLYTVLKQIANIINISTYKKNIENSDTYTKKGSKINFFFDAAKYISLIIFCAAIIPFFYSMEKSRDVWNPSPPEIESVPFATLDDFLPDSASRKSGNEGILYQKWSNYASSVNYYWSEDDDVTFSDGTTGNCRTIISYHETISPLLAKWVVWDYFFEDKSFEINSEVEKLSGDNFDYGIYYRTPVLSVVILQKGSKVLMTEFYFFSESDNSPTDEEVTEIICKNFE